MHLLCGLLASVRSIDGVRRSLRHTDAMHIEVRGRKRLVQAAVHTAVDIDLQVRKRIFRCQVEEGRENLDHWKEVERKLLDCGLRRVLLFGWDAFSGLAAVTAGMFPLCAVQLHTVHMLRNVQKHLGKHDFRIFQSEWQGVRSAWDPELGAGLLTRRGNTGRTQSAHTMSRFSPMPSSKNRRPVGGRSEHLHEHEDRPQGRWPAEHRGLPGSRA